ncbi:hypothetical protein BGW38_008351, partial [Lunasporangiospora selenospora]
TPVFVRLLMAQQINVDYACVSIGFETYKNAPLRAQLRYVELIRDVCPDDIF